MAEEKEKKVIKVNDLIIQADHVHFEPTGQERRPPFDPFFGRRPPMPTQSEAAETEDQETPKQEGESESENEQSQPQPERRRPFSWL
ncbi:hypothetical protein [Amphibacillus cookii]|uniref:hypothetical protein n=1 Tax=Amphibacillus cookii TaxID=767787 RepID=UPI0019592E40|nr:hypothetical protein [Amphibacillus cookii]MBM7540185.1 hypothetical protein [Amphibacillus cookii]